MIDNHTYSTRGQAMEINNPQAQAELTKQFERYQQAIIDNDVAVL